MQRADVAVAGLEDGDGALVDAGVVDGERAERVDGDEAGVVVQGVVEQQQAGAGAGDQQLAVVGEIAGGEVLDDIGGAERRGLQQASIGQRAAIIGRCLQVEDGIGIDLHCAKLLIVSLSSNSVVLSPVTSSLPLLPKFETFSIVLLVPPVASSTPALVSVPPLMMVQSAN